MRGKELLRDRGNFRLCPWKGKVEIGVMGFNERMPPVPRVAGNTELPYWGSLPDTDGQGHSRGDVIRSIN